MKFSASMTIKDILYLSYLIPQLRVRPLVPDVLPLAKVGDNKVFVSIVTFHCRDVRIVGLPSLQFTYDQINLRTYVKDPLTGNHGVYFFRSGITSAATTLFTHLLKLPWEYIKCIIKAESNKKNRYTNYTATGDWNGEIHIEVEEQISHITSIPPFADLEKAIQYLTNPLIGFYSASGKTYRFEIHHPEILPHSGKALRVHFPFLTTLGLIEESEIQQPHNILLARYGQFHVFLPPRSVR